MTIAQVRLPTIISAGSGRTNTLSAAGREMDRTTPEPLLMGITWVSWNTLGSSGSSCTVIWPATPLTQNLVDSQKCSSFMHLNKTHTHFLQTLNKFRPLSTHGLNLISKWNSNNVQHQPPQKTDKQIPRSGCCWTYWHEGRHPGGFHIIKRFCVYQQTGQKLTALVVDCSCVVFFVVGCSITVRSTCHLWCWVVEICRLLYFMGNSDGGPQGPLCNLDCQHFVRFGLGHVVLVVSLYQCQHKCLCWHLLWPLFDLVLTYFGRTNHDGCLLSKSGQQALLRFYVLIREQRTSWIAGCASAPKCLVVQGWPGFALIECDGWKT